MRLRELEYFANRFTCALTNLVCSPALWRTRVDSWFKEPLFCARAKLSQRRACYVKALSFSFSSRRAPSRLPDRSSPPPSPAARTFAKVVMGGGRYGRTVGTTVAPALSAAAAVTIVIAPCWTPVPGPKSIKKIAVVPANATAAAIAAGTSSPRLCDFSICIDLISRYAPSRQKFRV
jgi:hypothetical protein